MQTHYMPATATLYISHSKSHYSAHKHYGRNAPDAKGWGVDSGVRERQGPGPHSHLAQGPQNLNPAVGGADCRVCYNRISCQVANDDGQLRGQFITPWHFLASVAGHEP